MKLLNNHALIFTLVFTSVVNAQPLASQQAEQVFTLNITPAEVQMLGKGLGTLPYGEVAVLMGKLQAQINSQVKQPEAKPVEPKVEEKK